MPQGHQKNIAYESGLEHSHNQTVPNAANPRTFLPAGHGKNLTNASSGRRWGLEVGCNLRNQPHMLHLDLVVSNAYYKKNLENLSSVGQLDNWRDQGY